VRRWRTSARSISSSVRRAASGAIRAASAPRKSAIDAQLADPAIYDDEKKDTLKALIVDQAYVARELAQFEAEWLTLQEQLDAVAQ